MPLVVMVSFATSNNVRYHRGSWHRYERSEGHRYERALQLGARSY